ncbi:Ig-like domain repeat protein [Dactylosporangium sp. CS-033363]|uniref:Ig-like domain repeat protein n=1 Tax=Dactylosporangium sp. CS-033363 TaxID=3239935 RepID=UPI003D8DBD5A
MRRVTVGAALAAVVSAGALTLGVDPAFAQQPTLTVTASPNPSTRTQQVTVCATVNEEEANGTMTFSGAGLPDNSIVGVDSSTSKACVLSTDLETGRVTVNYSGNYGPLTDGVDIVVNLMDTTTTVTATPNPSVSGASVELCATVEGAGIPERARTEDFTPTGTVTFDFTSGSQTANLNGSGQACVTPSEVGAGTVTATYSGDFNFDPSTGTTTVTRNKADTTTTVTAVPDPSVHGQSVQVCAAVAATPPGSGTPTGTVTFTGGLTQTVPLSNGEACATVTDLTGAMITANYAGDTAFKASMGSVSPNVNAADTTTTVTATPDPSVTGESVEVCAMVAASPPGGGTPTGDVIFSDANGIIDTKPLDGTGQACATTTNLATGTVTATYGGTEEFGGSVGTQSVTVDPATTATTVTATPPTSAAGDSVEVCATVAVSAPGSGTPAGSVTFTGAGLNDTKTLSGGVACTTSTSLSTGTINAAYNGSDGYAVSSGTTSVTVSENPSNPNPPVVNTPVPSVPRNVTAVPLSSAVRVTWDAPNSGSPVTGYTVTASPGPATCDTTTETMCVLGAVAGTSYTYTVVAHSAAGDSEPSTATAATTPEAPSTPAAPPSTNLTLTTTDGQITTAAPGQVVTFVGTGFAPYSTVTITIYSTPIELGRVTTDATGSFQVPITLPQQLAAAQHTVVAQGSAPDGSVRAMSLAVAVAAAPVITNPPAAGSLPVTGPPVGVLLLTGLVLAVTGAGLVRMGRRTA